MKLQENRKTFKRNEWLKLFLYAPLNVFKISDHAIYVVEADCDRKFEGKFIGSLLRPDIAIWLNVSNTHTINFRNIKSRGLEGINELVVKEFGNIIKNTKELVIYNGDDKNIESFISLHKPKNSLSIKTNNYKFDYQVSLKGTTFYVNENKYNFKYLLPKATIYSLISINELLSKLKIQGEGYQNFVLPPGRSSLLTGKKGSLIIDSTYNSNLESIIEVVSMFNSLESKRKVIVLGDMIELGADEIVEYRRLSNYLRKIKKVQFILVGKRVSKLVLPNLTGAKAYVNAGQATPEIIRIMGPDLIILFKGAGFLEGIVEKILSNKIDERLLVRREKVWVERRNKFF